MKKENAQLVTGESSGRERTIALMGRDLVFEIPIGIFRAVRELARLNQFRLLYVSGETYKIPFAFDTKANILNDLVSPKIADGIIVISSLLSAPTSPDEFRERCRRFHPLPVVSLGIAYEGIPSVVLDNSAGMYDAVSHLIEVHHLRKIAFIHGLEGHHDAIERFSAFSRAMETHDVPVEESLILHGDFQYESGTTAVRELLDARGKVPGRDVQAIVCCNDYMASAVVIELERRGIAIPAEIAVMGFDDIPFTTCTKPSLSTVHQPFDILAAKATELLLNLMEGKAVPESVHVSSRFIPRGSCGCLDVLDHTEYVPLSDDPAKLHEIAPEEKLAYLNSEIIKSVKPTLMLWKHAISHLWAEDKWDLKPDTASAPLNCSRDAWGLLSRIANNTFNSNNYQNIIYKVGNVLASTLEIPELMSILTRMLPDAGIKRCCICLYEDPERTPGMLPPTSNLILAFNQDGSEVLPPGGLRFATVEFLPKEIVLKQGWNSWVIMPLFYKEEQLGYVLVDSDAPHEDIHWNLRNQISSALKGARLLDETRKANDLLVQANEQKTQFFINVAHETKTPLTLIQNYLSRYLARHESDEELIVIKENIDLLLGHMLNFLDAERLRKGEIIYHHDSLVDLAEAARGKCELFAAIASKKNIRLIIDAESRVIIRIDPKALDRIFNNLLDNAVKYIQEGGRIQIDIRCGEGKAVLRVSDNGPGIPADASEHIFEPYYLLSKKKSGEQGIGVGLSIVKRIVDELGASIEVKTGAGKGTCFTISFAESVGAEGETLREIPQTAPPASKVQEAIKEKNITEDKRSILIVDDNLQLLKFIQTSFSESYNVFLARSTAEALSKLKIIPRPDVIVSDIMMDGIDGFGLLSALSKKEGYNNIPFIFLTALGGEKEKLKGLDLGALDYIEKPFSVAMLQAKIESIIALRARQERTDRERIRNHIHGLLTGSSADNVESENSGFEKTCRKYRIAGSAKEILQMLMKRLTNKEIASLMNVSQRAVEYQITKIFKKCGVKNKFDLLDIFLP
jgi:signal transduction histidine kinase/DNA-binding LacI/PurR family transcriptional regulator/DNA-binding response OmpR family regulator